MKKLEFNLVRLLETVFGELKGKRVGVFIDLEDPRVQGAEGFRRQLNALEPEFGLDSVGKLGVGVWILSAQAARQFARGRLLAPGGRLCNARE
mgnify:CR=1 FL=1